MEQGRKRKSQANPKSWNTVILLHYKAKDTNFLRSIYFFIKTYLLIFTYVLGWTWLWKFSGNHKNISALMDLTVLARSRGRENKEEHK